MHAHTTAAAGAEADHSHGIFHAPRDCVMTQSDWTTILVVSNTQLTLSSTCVQCGHGCVIVSCAWEALCVHQTDSLLHHSSISQADSGKCSAWQSGRGLFWQQHCTTLNLAVLCRQYYHVICDKCPISVLICVPWQAITRYQRITFQG